MMKTTGLVIKSINYGEANKIITMLTPQGKVQMVANGARSHKCHLFAGAQPFCYSSIVLQKGKGKLPYLKSCEVIESFYPIRTDVFKVALAAYFAELLDIMALTEDCEEILRFILNTLYILETKENGNYLKPVFELRLLSLLGFRPQLEQCAICGKEHGLERFSVEEGGVVCDTCFGGLRLMQDTLAAMRYIVETDGKALYSFSLSETVEDQLMQICEQFLLYHLEHKPKTLEYFHKLMKSI